jgi:PAS domain S-box-containing protein
MGPRQKTADGDDPLRHYQRIVEAAGDIIFTTDMNGACTFITASIERLLGYKPEAVIGKSFVDFVHPDWRERTLAFYAHQTADGLPQSAFELLAITADGEPKWIEQIVIPLFDDQTWVGYEGVARDVTRRKQAEADLQTSEANLRALMNNTQDSIWSVDCGYRLVSFNQTFAERMRAIFGVELQPGMRIYDDPKMPPDHAPRWQGLYDRALRGESFSVEMSVGAGDNRVEAELLFNPIKTDDGNITGVTVFSRNITERKRAEAALRASEERFRQMTDSIQTGIFIFQDEGVIYVNRAVETLTGYPLAEVRQLDMFDDLLHPDHRDLQRERWAQRLRGEAVPDHIEFQIVTKQGQARWMEADIKQIELDGQITILGTVEDITERKRDQAALSESEARYRMVVEGQSELICRFHPDTTLTFVNDAYCRYFGERTDDLIGRSFLHHIPEEGRQRALDHLAQTIAGRETTLYQHTALNARGELEWLEWVDTPIFDDHDQIVEFQSVGRNITDRKRAETERFEYINRLEILQQLDMELMQVLKLDYVLKIALDAAVRLSHAEGGVIHLVQDEQLMVAQVIGNFPAAPVGAVVPHNRGIVGRVMHNQQAEWVADVNADPDYYANLPETRAQITLPLISQDTLIGILNVQTSQPDSFTQSIFDFLKLLSARIASAVENARLYRVVEEQLTETRRLYQQMSALEQMKTQMIRIASHDLRNPLGIISGYLQMLNWDLDTVFNDRTREYLKFIKQAIDRMDKITRDILTLERVTANQKGIPTDSFNLVEVVQAAFEEYRQQAAEHAQDYQLNLPAAAPIVQGDRALLKESVANLIGNAIKYTPQEGRVAVSLRLDEQRGAIFEVSDSGYGIPDEQQANLFQAFYRVVTKETKTIKGTGLGLHLVKTIIERHGGQMRFHSVYGQGSTFGFQLPLAKKSKKSRKTVEARKVVT